MNDETAFTDEPVRDVVVDSQARSQNDAPDPCALLRYLESDAGRREADERARNDFARDFQHRLVLESFGRELQGRFPGSKVYIRGRRVEMSPPSWSVVVGSVRRANSEADLKATIATALRTHGEADFLLLQPDSGADDDDLPF